jgi:hypothetical protein
MQKLHLECGTCYRSKAPGPSVLGLDSLGEDCSPGHVVGHSDHDYHGEKNACREVPTLRRGVD